MLSASKQLTARASEDLVIERDHIFIRHSQVACTCAARARLTAVDGEATEAKVVLWKALACADTSTSPSEAKCLTYSLCNSHSVPDFMSTSRCQKPQDGLPRSPVPAIARQRTLRSSRATCHTARQRWTVKGVASACPDEHIVHSSSAGKIAAQIAAGHLSCQQVVAAHLESIADEDKRIHAWVCLNDHAMQDAQAIGAPLSVAMRKLVARVLTHLALVDVCNHLIPS